MAIVLLALVLRLRMVCPLDLQAEGVRWVVSLNVVCAHRPAPPTHEQGHEAQSRACAFPCGRRLAAYCEPLGVLQRGPLLSAFDCLFARMGRVFPLPGLGIPVRAVRSLALSWFWCAFEAVGCWADPLPFRCTCARVDEHTRWLHTSVLPLILRGWLPMPLLGAGCRSRLHSALQSPP